MYKEDFLAIGGHDPLFAPQSKEDSDLFNRFVLNGYKVLQTWEGLVYHFTSRGSRFNKHAGGAAGQNSNEWIHTTTKNGREFIRKWGHFVKHDSLMKPIIPSKYDIGFIVKNCSNQLLAILEPWCSTIYVDESNDPAMCDNYITLESPNTSFDLYERIRPFDNEKNNETLVMIDGNKFTQKDFQIIQQLSEILTHDEQLHEDIFIEPTHFEIENLHVTIANLNTYEKELICVS
jgi:hypothetical protein